MSVAKNINYNPALTPEQNAKKNGVSVSTIKKYIQKNDIDRRYDKKIALIDKCRKFLKTNPGATKKLVQEKLGYSQKTLRMYWDYITTEKELPGYNPNKVKRRSQRQLNNFYATHPSIVKDLLTYESFNERILEPFCGTGLISDALKEYGYEVESYDLINRGYGNVGDFFKVDYPTGYYDIVTNPPYDAGLTPEIIIRCLQLCNKRVAMLLPLDYLTGIDRYNKVFQNNPLKTVYVYINRIDVAKNADFENYSHGGLQKYAWYIWEKGYKGTTEMKWLLHVADREHNKLLKKYIQTPILKKITDIVNEEHENTIRIEETKSVLPYPTKADLFKAEEERYDASNYLCFAFRRKQDKHKDVELPLGNMISGYPFKIGRTEFPTSEHAYILGLFSNDTERHTNIQKQLLAEPDGYLAKQDIRRRNEKYGRKDWNEFNVEWMLYCVWQKALGNKDFRDLLMSVPEGATIIENSTFQQKPKTGEDKPAFWGCRNEEQKEFHRLVQKYVTQKGGSSAEQDKRVAEYMDDCCNYGTFVGHNTMGKILMIVKKCLHDGTEPDINYELLRRKSIWINGIPANLNWGKIKTKFKLSDFKK